MSHAERSSRIMSLQPSPIAAVPEETARVARAAFPKGNRYLEIRDVLGTIYTDEMFADLFPRRGQPTEAPWRLALVTVFQFLEGLSDRQAAEAVRGRIDWKYALGLELSDAGFDASILSEFRSRLVAHQASGRLLEVLVERLNEGGWIKARGKQRTDSTHVLGAVRLLNRLELVGETLRAALEEVATIAPDWVKSWVPQPWFERYGRRIEEGRLPKGEKERQQYAQQVGADGAQLLAKSGEEDTPAVVRELAALKELLVVWQQQYEQQEGSIRLRNKDDLPPSAERHDSPYDPEVRYSTKREMHWIGYKVHLTETCEPEQVEVITHVETTYAPVADVEQVATIHEALCAKGVAPGEHFATQTCLQCPVRAQCTRSAKMGRQVTVRPQAEHEALQHARLYQQSEAFRQEYARRAGVEGTISQAVRAFGLRQTRYVGLAKTNLQEIGTAVALDLCRWVDWHRHKPRA